LVKEQDKIQQCQVLILTDNHGALQFYDSESDKENRLESTLEHADDYKNAINTLSDCFLDIFISKVKSNKTTKGAGFFDHEAADHLAALARNKRWAERFQHEWTDTPPFGPLDLEWLKNPVNNSGRFKERLSEVFGV
jgi:uncharacterized protein YbaP (TraB family)